MNTMNSFPISWLNYTEKHSNGRQNTSAKRKRTLTADRVPDAAGWCTLMADRVPATKCGNTPTADRMLASIEWSTLTADRMLPQLDEVLSRPTECFRNRMEYSHGRQNACSDRMKYSDGRQNASAIGDNTLTADTILTNVGGDKMKRTS